MCLACTRGHHRRERLTTFLRRGWVPRTRRTKPWAAKEAEESHASSPRRGRGHAVSHSSSWKPERSSDRPSSQLQCHGLVRPASLPLWLVWSPVRAVRAQSRSPSSGAFTQGATVLGPSRLARSHRPNKDVRSSPVRAASVTNGMEAQWLFLLKA